MLTAGQESLLYGLVALLCFACLIFSIAAGQTAFMHAVYTFSAFATVTLLGPVRMLWKHENAARAEKAFKSMDA